MQEDEHCETILVGSTRNSCDEL